MPIPRPLIRAAALGLSLLLGACATQPPIPMAAPAPAAPAASNIYLLANRLSWGASTSTVELYTQQGWQKTVANQLHPTPRPLLPELQAQIDAMAISSTPLPELVRHMEQQRKDADGTQDDDAKKAAQQAYQQELNRLQREAGTRHLLRALYSPNQVQEEMTWFWLNHFSVHQGKSNLRAMLGDYEESALRAHALGNFRELLGAASNSPSASSMSASASLAGFTGAESTGVSEGAATATPAPGLAECVGLCTAGSQHHLLGQAPSF